MALDSILTSLTPMLAGVPSAQALQPIIDKLAGEVDSAARERVAALAANPNRSAQDDKLFNVLSAGVLGVLPGGDSLKPVLEPVYGWRVNSFLSALRHAMVNSKPLAATMKKRSDRFIFYPEFYYEFPDSLDQRIAAVARAHAGLGPTSPDLPALYTLGGLFDGAASLKQLKAMGQGGGGTSCVMTARAIYHAAGCDMIDGGDLTVNTPSGPMIDLGTPTRRTWNDGTKHLEARRGRADTAHNGGKAFKDNDMGVRPHLTIGDIYYVEGTGDHLYLARGGGALAVHVGIIVGHSGDTYFTVDGGQGQGADVGLSPMRKMMFKKNGGWSFAEQNPKSKEWGYHNATRSYNTSEVEIIRNAANDLTTDEGLLARIQTDPAFAGHKKSFPKLLADYKANIGKPQEKFFEGQLNMVRAALRRLAKVVAGGRTGEVRTIHGWWESESYDQLEWAGPQQIAQLARA